MKINVETDGEVIKRKAYDGQSKVDSYYGNNAVVRHNGYWYEIKPKSDSDSFRLSRKLERYE